MSPQPTAPPLLDRVRSSNADGPLVSAILATYGLSLDEPNFFEVDFLPTLLGIGGTRDRGYAIPVTLERKLAETSCILIADAHALAAGARPSLRVDVLPISGVTQHAKVFLLHRKRSIRLIIGSANLTHDSFRHNREAVVALDFSDSGGLPSQILASAVEEWNDALASRGSTALYSALTRAVEAVRGWTGKALGQSRSIGVVFGGGKVPLWRKFVDAWPAGERVLEWQICSPFWADPGAPKTPFETIAHALDRKGADLSAAELTLICRGDALGEAARPKFPFAMVERLRSSGFPIRQGSICAARLDMTPEESIETKSAHDRDLHAKYVMLRGTRTSLVLVGSANFTCRGFGTAERPNIEAGVIIKGPAAEIGSSWQPPIARSGIVDWASCAGAVLGTPDNSDEPVQWPSFISNIDLEVFWDQAVDPRGCLTVTRAADSPPFVVLVERDGGASTVGSCMSAVSARPIDLDPQYVREILVRRYVLVQWSNHEVRFPINIAEGSKMQLPSVLGVRPSEQELLAYFHHRISEEDLIARLQQRNKSSEQGPPSVPPAPELQSYLVRDFVETLRPMAESLRNSMYSAPAFENALLGEFSPSRLAEEIAEAFRSGRRSVTATCFQLIELLRVLSLLEVPGNLPSAETRAMRDHKERAVKLILDRAAALTGVPAFQHAGSTAIRAYAKTRLTGQLKKRWFRLVTRRPEHCAQAAARGQAR